MYIHSIYIYWFYPNFSVKEERPDDVPANTKHNVDLLVKGNINSDNSGDKRNLVRGEGDIDSLIRPELIDNAIEKTVAKIESEQDTSDDHKGAEDKKKDTDAKPRDDAKLSQTNLGELRKPWPPVEVPEDPHLYKLPGEDTNVSVSPAELDMV